MIGIGGYVGKYYSTILQVVNERFCIENRIVTNLSFVVCRPPIDAFSITHALAFP